MRIFFVSNDFAGASLARRLVLEGHEVRAFVADPACERIMHGLIPRIPSLDAGLDWIGRDGLAVVDDTGFGEWQDAARADGFAVVGGSALGDRLELDRAWAMDTLGSLGIGTLPTLRFRNCADAATHIQGNPQAWAVKFDHRAPKAATFIGTLPCGSDSLDFLSLCTERCNSSCDCCGTILQRHTAGVEIGVGRYFNGRNWLGPAEHNMEHKRFFSGNLGPNTFEMGTLLWYVDDHALFDQVLAPLAPFLVEAGFHGDTPSTSLAMAPPSPPPANKPTISPASSPCRVPITARTSASTAARTSGWWKKCSSHWPTPGNHENSATKKLSILPGIVQFFLLACQKEKLRSDLGGNVEFRIGNQFVQEGLKFFQQSRGIQIADGGSIGYDNHGKPRLFKVSGSA